MQEEEFVIEPSGHLINVKEIWHYRELFYFFTWRDIKVKYKQTFFGIAWAIVQPLFLVIIFSVFFGHALKVSTGDLPYPVFAFSGLLLWTLFSSGLNNAGNSIISNSAIIKKIYFPRLVIPVSSIIAAVFDFVFGLLVFLGLLIFYQTKVDWLVLIYAWPLAFLFATLGTLGPSCLLAALNVKYRDFRYAIPFVIQVMFFLTPVIYPVGLLKHAWLKYLVSFNPVCAAIDLFRLPLGSTPIGGSVMWVSISSALLFLILGLYYFRQTERYFADLA
jgi:lipopolysaccharide transport system permease protein